MPKVVSIKELRLFQNENASNHSWGLVPTMGSLHEGHLSIIKKSVSENLITFVTIFVNPTQFDDKKDLDNYPSSVESDLEKIHAIDPAICVFVPKVSSIYPDGTASKKYELKELDKTMEGQNRPGHFNGVATVVQRLFELIQPDVAYFGQKDFQQLQIVSLIGKSMNIQISSVPTVREANGLAMSSRNNRLSIELRNEAQLIYNVLKMSKEKFLTHSISEIKTLIGNMFDQSPAFVLEYFEIADESTLKIADEKQKNTTYRAFIAVKVDGIRLIDNLSLN